MAWSFPKIFAENLQLHVLQGTVWSRLSHCCTRREAPVSARRRSACSSATEASEGATRGNQGKLLGADGLMGWGLRME